MKHNLNGKQYDLIYVDEIPDDPTGVAFGECDHPDTTGKKIRIKKDISLRMLVEALIHEGIHACFWCLDEEEVRQSAEDIAVLLMKELQMQYEEKAPEPSHED